MSRERIRTRPNKAMQPTACRSNRRFQFHKRQLFIRTHNEPLSVTAMGISNEDCSPARIQRLDAARISSGFAEIVSEKNRPSSPNAFGVGHERLAVF